MAAVVIVGAGLFGSMAAKACRMAGHTVTIIDDGRPSSGSRPAACLMKPTWLMNLGPLAKPGLESLGRMYHIMNLEFTTWMNIKVPIQWVDPKTILERYPTVETVQWIGNGVVETSHRRFYGHVLVATGCWANELINGIEEVKRLTGVALTYSGERDKPVITSYAPFKQAISFVRDLGTTWFGDGTAILAKNWGTEYIEQSIRRAEQLHGLKEDRLFAQCIGERPIVKSHQGLFEQVSGKTWVVTGGGKNGTVLAAYYAKKFVEAIS